MLLVEELAKINMRRDAEIMFVNQIPFIITYGKGVGLITMEWIPNRTWKQLESNLVLQLYIRGGFIVQTILMNMEFEKIRHLTLMANINISAANEHMAKVEGRIRTIKER